MRTLLLLSPVVVIALGCTRPPPPVAPPAPPVVEVVRPKVQDVTEYQDFTGRSRASDTADLKARVTGYLTAIHVKDGDRVSAGQPLFDLDPGLYATELARAEAVVKQAGVAVKQATAAVAEAQAKLARLTKDYQRVRSLTTASQSERDQTEGQWEEAKAAVEVAKAAVEVAQAGAVVGERQVAQARKNLEYTKIVAPKAGRIGRHLVDVGSLVKADDTLLATVVVNDPAWVFFDVDDRTLLRLNRLMAAGKLNLSADGRTEVRVALPDEDAFSADSALVGRVRFIDTQVNAGTGTITLRADVDNPAGLITPGLFVRVRLPIGEGKRAVLVPEEAIGVDQDKKFVFVLNDQDEAVYRQVKVGLQVGNDRVVEPVTERDEKTGQPRVRPDSGVTEQDRVITEGLQRVRKGMKVSVRGKQGAGAGGQGPGAESQGAKQASVK
jgi:multidrug efflux system membrane fusion protein